MIDMYPVVLAAASSLTLYYAVGLCAWMLKGLS